MIERSRPKLTGRRRIGGDGEPDVFVADEQAIVDGSPAIPVDLARWRDLTLAVLAAEGVRGAAELSVMFIDEDAITALNMEFMEVNGPTDVLAFPIDVDVELVPSALTANVGPDRSPGDPGDLPLLLGDVVVCPAVAARQAPDHAGTFEDEVALLVVHGVLHVLGYDHVEVDEGIKMRARERELLEAHHWHGPTPVGFRQEQD
jgi:probable rRNA maturation factor